MFKLVKSSIKSAFKGVRNDPEVRKVISRFPRFFKFVKKRLTPDEIFGLYLTVGIIVSAIFIYLFLNILFGLFTQDLLVMSDLRVLNIAATYRTPSLDQFMFFITTLGSGEVIFTGASVFAIFFYLTNHWRYLVSILTSVVFGEFFYRIFKHVIERPRPPISLSLVHASGYSFPSGHAFMAMAFYGLITYFIYRSFKDFRVRHISSLKIGLKYRKFIVKYNKTLRAGAIMLFALLIGFIGYSRIYLGVHWPTDVLAGFAAGAAWITVFVTVLEIRRKFRRHIAYNRQHVTKMIGLILFLIWVIFTGYFWSRESGTAFIKNSQRGGNEEKIIINEEDIQGKIFENLPKVSETISGKPQEPVHIIILGSEEQIKSAFNQAGWLECDRLSTKNLERLAVASILNKPYPAAPGVPSLWNTLPNDLSFEKPTVNNSVRERHHIHFWETRYALDSGHQIWFATAHYDTTIKMRTAVLPIHSIDPAIDKEREEIKKELLDTGKVDSVSEFQIVEPTLGKNQSGDLFFTDGKAYVFYLN